MITYKELERIIGRMSEEQKGMDVTVYTSAIEEFYPVDGIGFIKEPDENRDVLDAGHPYLIMDDAGGNL